MDPDMALQYTQHGPLYIGYIFAFYATKIGSRDSGERKVNVKNEDNLVYILAFNIWSIYFVSPESLDPVLVE